MVGLQFKSQIFYLWLTEKKQDFQKYQINLSYKAIYLRFRLLNVLQQTTIQEDSSGGIDSVTLALQMGLLYALDMSVLHRFENGEGKSVEI